MRGSPARTMRAARFHGDSRITIEDAPVPEPAPGEVLLRVLRTALCGSDTKLWRKGASVTPGHEILGRVKTPGHPLQHRRCLVYIPLHCGTCAACRAGDTQMCLTVSCLIGWNRPGGYGEWVAVPENCLLPVPDDVDDTLAPLLLDTIGTSAHAVRFVQPLVPPQTCGPVLVTGAGPVGLGVVIALQSLGYPEVVVSDPNPARLALARSFGADVLPVGDASRRFRLVMECSGAHAARDLGIEVVLPRGALVLIGENEAPWAVQEGKVFRRKDFCMVRTFYFPKRDFAPNIDLLRANEARYRRLVDSEFGLDDLPETFARFVRGERLKPLLSPA